MYVGHEETSHTFRDDLKVTERIEDELV